MENTKNRRVRERGGDRPTCLTDSAISGPIPSPGKRVARIVVAEEEKALGATKAVLGFEWLPRARRRRWEAMIEILISERERERERETRKMFEGESRL